MRSTADGQWWLFHMSTMQKAVSAVFQVVAVSFTTQRFRPVADMLRCFSVTSTVPLALALARAVLAAPVLAATLAAVGTADARVSVSRQAAARSEAIVAAVVESAVMSAVARCGAVLLRCRASCASYSYLLGTRRARRYSYLGTRRTVRPAVVRTYGVRPSKHLDSPFSH